MSERTQIVGSSANAALRREQVSLRSHLNESLQPNWLSGFTNWGFSNRFSSCLGVKSPAFSGMIKQSIRGGGPEEH